MKTKLMIVGVAVLLVFASCKKEGCTDELANNYSKKAKKDDGTCTYADGVITQTITTNITTPTVIGDKTIKICGDISISAGFTLQPGAVVIMCAGSSIEVLPTGYISAVGTATNPIVIKGETETKGFWEGLSIQSNNPNNKFSYTTIKDAGTYWGWEFATVFVADQAKLEINNSTISNSENVAMYVHETATLVSFANNIFSNSVTGLSIGVTGVSKIDGASQYGLNNTNNFIMVRTGTLNTDATWPKTTTPLLVNGVTVNAGLTLSPGVNILVEADGDFNIQSTGYLNSVGTALDPISIQGRYNSSAYWQGIFISSNNPNNMLKYTTVKDGGGYWGYEYANVYVDGKLTVDNSTIANGNSYGIYVNTSSTIISAGITQIAAAGVEANNTFIANGVGPNANCVSGCTIFFE